MADSGALSALSPTECGLLGSVLASVFRLLFFRCT